MIIFTFFSCSQQSNKDNSNINELKKSTKFDIKHENANIHSVDTIIDITKKCKCDKNINDLSLSTDLTINKNEVDFDTLLTSNSFEIENIKSIKLCGYDTIPKDFKIFKNVETVLITPSIDMVNFSGVGLENFPKFRNLSIFATIVDLTNNPKWLRQVEIFEAQKSHISGLKSFKQMPNLRKMELRYSGFDSFPKNFESMHCLNSFQLIAYSFNVIDLSKIDLSKLPCLKYIEFHSWDKGFIGIPKGIESVEKVKISHGNLTKDEKNKLKSVANNK